MKVKQRRNAPVRSSNEAVLSANIPAVLKASLQGRAQLLDRPISNLVRYAIEYQDNRKWEGISLAVLSESEQKRLERWLAEGGELALTKL